MGLIVELEEGVWLAPWDGDPGRTLKKESAKIFECGFSAMKALLAAKELRPFKNASIYDTHD